MTYEAIATTTTATSTRAHPTTTAEEEF